MYKNENLILEHDSEWVVFLGQNMASSKHMEVVVYNEWHIRSIAMVLYYAEHSYFDSFGVFTTDLVALDAFAQPPILSGSECSQLPIITLGENQLSFDANVTDNEFVYTASIRNDRLLTVAVL